MSKISLRGYDSLDGLCDALPGLLDKKVGKLKKCKLFELSRRGESAFMLFLCHNFLMRGEWPFAVSICADGDAFIADVMSVTRFVEDYYQKKLLELTAEVLRERGFEDFERESWNLGPDSRPDAPEPPPLNAPLPEQTRDKKRAYDPEI